MKYKKIIFVVIIIFLFSTYGEFYAFSAASAELISDAQLIYKDAPLSRKCLDGSVYTGFDTDGATPLNITSSVIVGGVYLKFSNVTDKYFINIGNEIIECGQYGFLHEYIDLTKYNTASFSIVLPKNKLCDIKLYSVGKIPTSVQIWNPSYDDADMLVLPTHSDDDSLFLGGAISTYSKDYKVQVAHITHHNDTVDRRHELLDGLWEMGITAYPVQGFFQDKYSKNLEHAKSIYNENEIISHIEQLIVRFKPEVVVGHDLNGEYGHGMHMLGALALTKAVENARQNFGVQKLYLHLYKENPIVLDVDTVISKLGKTPRQASTDAYNQHTSQHKWDFKVTDTIKYFGLYKTTVGTDTGNNMFENVVFPKIDIPKTDEVIDNTNSKSHIKEITTKKTNFSYKIILTIAVLIVLIALVLVYLKYIFSLKN